MQFSSAIALQDLQRSTSTLPTSDETFWTNVTSDVGCVFNDTACPSDAPRFHGGSLVRVVVLSLIGLLSLTGNILTLASVLKERSRKRSTVYLLIGQLALADVLVSVFCVLAEAVWTWTVAWLAGDASCKALKFLQMFGLYLSTFVLVVIGFDRFAAVRFPLSRATANKVVKRMVVAAWILSGLFSLPQVYIFRVVRGPFRQEFFQCVTYGAYTADWQEQLYSSLNLVVMFLLPLATLLITYTCTFYTIAKRERHSVSVRQPLSVNPGEGPNPSSDDHQGARRKLLHRAKMKTLMVTVVIVLAFVVCWTPYYVMMIIFIFLEPNEQLSDDLQSAIFFFGSSTALVNPLIYGAFHLRRRGSRGKNALRDRVHGTTTTTLTTLTTLNHDPSCKDGRLLQASDQEGKGQCRWGRRRKSASRNSGRMAADTTIVLEVLKSPEKKVEQEDIICDHTV